MVAPIFEVSGSDGSAGVAGIDRGHSKASPGNHGRRGGNGSQGLRGTAAGSIVLRLSTPESTALLPENVVLAHPIDIDVMIDANLVLPSGGSRRMDTILKMDAGESISLLAKGGDGGRGGDGGDGEHGGTGIRYLP
jgi:hypothetical protein